MNRTVVWTRLEKSTPIDIKTKASDFSWNPSITRHKDNIFVSYRGYSKDDKSFRKYFSPLLIAKLENEKPTGVKVIRPRNVPDYVKECGIEDVRIWSDGKNLYGIGVLLSELPNKRLKIRLGEIKINYTSGYYDLIEDFGQPYSQPEKNWSPIEGRPHEYMYSLEKIYTDGKILSTVDRVKINHKIIHNGTPFVKIKGGYITVAHQRTRLRNGDGCYPNFFVKYDENLVPTHCTDWFVFKDYMNEEVQFMSGAALLDEDTLAITVGLDRITAKRPALYKSLLYKVKLSNIDWQPYSPVPLHNGIYKEGNK